jgi:prepilin-type N-terminal cleavage/methylation domain-containing protein
MLRTVLQKTDRRDPLKSGAGFTLMEILVAATIFAVVVSALSVLFNYTLKINRRTEALRQATQGMRNFVEFLVKEVRNGQIDYGLIDPAGQARNGSIYPIGSSPCIMPVVGPSPITVQPTYGSQDNKLAVLNQDGSYECFYLAYGPGNKLNKNTGDAAPSSDFGATVNNPNPVLALQKSSIPLGGAEILSSPNVSVQKLVFLVRPLCDPYSQFCQPGTTFAKTQPFVTILAQFLLALPTGETTTINYQTSVSGNKYDIPKQ